MEFIPISKPSLGDLEVEMMTEAIKSGWISSHGKFIVRFEQEFARFCGTRYAIATSNGTTALHLALIAAGLKAGDEVIVPNLTFVATANVVMHAGATPVFVDIDRNTLCLDPAAAQAAITPHTKVM